MKVGDVPESLPPHPQEAKLRRGEKELAATLRELTDKIAKALEDDAPDKTRSRVDAAVGLQQLKDTADAGRAAEARAIQDQMMVLPKRQKTPPKSKRRR